MRGGWATPAALQTSQQAHELGPIDKASKDSIPYTEPTSCPTVKIALYVCVLLRVFVYLHVVVYSGWQHTAVTPVLYYMWYIKYANLNRPLLP